MSTPYGEPPCTQVDGDPDGAVVASDEVLDVRSVEIGALDPVNPSVPASS